MKLASLLILALVYNIGVAAPAFPGKITFQNKNGSSFVGRLKGNEWFHWIETEKGQVVLYNPTSQNYEYARTTQTNNVLDIEPGGIMTTDPINRSSLASDAISTTLTQQPSIQQLRKIFQRYNKQYSGH